jgi:DNA primase
MTFNIDNFMAVVKQVKELKKQAEAAPIEAAADARGQAIAQEAASAQVAAAGNEQVQVAEMLGGSAGEQQALAEGSKELADGQNLLAQAAQEMAVDTVINQPTNAETLQAKVASEDRIATILAAVKDELGKHASEEDADELYKTAEEAVQYGRLMALGFLDGVQEILNTEGEEE